MSDKKATKEQKADKMKTMPMPEVSIAAAKLEVMELLIEQKNSEIEYLRGLVKILVSEPEEEAGHVENN